MTETLSKTQIKVAIGLVKSPNHDIYLIAIDGELRPLSCKFKNTGDESITKKLSRASLEKSFSTQPVSFKPEPTFIFEYEDDISEIECHVFVSEDYKNINESHTIPQKWVKKNLKDKITVQTYMGKEIYPMYLECMARMFKMEHNKKAA